MGFGALTDFDASFALDVPTAVSAALARVAEQHGLSRRSLLAAAWAALESRYSSEETPAIRPCDTPLALARKLAARPGGSLDLALDARVSNGCLEARILYRASAHSAAFAARLGRHFLHLLGGMLDHPDRALARIPFLPEPERDALTRALNPGTDPPDGPDTLNELFERQAARTPDLVALECGAQRWTYRALNQAADELAQRLLARAAFDGAPIAPAPVALLLERGPSILLAALAILKSGAAYLPLDPAYPDERLRLLLEDSRAGWVLGESSLKSRLDRLATSGSAARVLWLDERAPAPRRSAVRRPRTGPRDLAYVIYTSGSTGRPKGVAIEHAGAAALARTLIARLALGPGVRVLQFAPAAFDASVYEWIGTLGSGATLVVATDGELPPRADVSDVLADRAIHVAMLPPSVIRSMKPRALPELRVLISGGEACTPDIVQSWAPGRTLLNAYGPTEATVVSTLAELRAGAPISLGTAIAGKRVFVLNRWLEPVPAGVTGELCVSGEGLARGYLHRPGDSAEKFVALPEDLRRAGLDAGARLYRTGDLARITEHGELEYLGRADDQVKINGHRIELGEVEACLGECPLLRESAVIHCREAEAASGRLVVYYVPSEPAASDAELAAAVEATLRRRLPAHAVPRQYRRIARLPLTANGKLDRAELARRAIEPSPEGPPGAEPPVTERERLLQEIWEELLGVRGIGVNQSFYALGGDSISAIAMLHRAEARGLSIRADELLRHPEIRALARAARALAPASDTPETLPFGQPFELTPIQHWFFERHLRQPDRFAQTQVIRCAALDEQRLEAALDALLLRHDAFRLAFPIVGGARRQVYRQTPHRPAVQRGSLEGARDPDRAAEGWYARWQRDLDFETGRTVAIAILHGHPDGKARLFIAIHHLIVDGVSWRILLEDLWRLYAGEDLGGSTSSTGIPSHIWRRALQVHAAEPATLAELPHWVEAKRVPPEFRLPLREAARAMAPSAPTGSTIFRVTRPASDVIPNPARALPVVREHRAEILLAAYALGLSEWTASRRVAFQLEGHGREALAGVEAGRGVGWYTTLFPVVLELPDTADLVAILRAVKERYRAIPRRGLSYGVLRYLHPEPEVRRALGGDDVPLLFNYLGSFGNRRESASAGWELHDDGSAQDVMGENERCLALFELNCAFVDDRFTCQVGYSPARFEERAARDFVERFVARARAICLALAEDPDRARTPSDFPDAGLDADQLERILREHAAHGRIQKIYPLTPLQEGLLFYHGIGAAPDTHFVQSIWRYEAALDTERMRRAWAVLAREHDVFRTFYVWNAGARPVQCVVDRAELDFRVTDLSHLPPAAQEDEVRGLLERDRQRPFELSRPGPIRVQWIRRGGERAELVLSHHHAALDGWSLPVLLARAHELYAGVEQPPEPARVAPSFERFVRELRAKDRTAAAAHFAAVLGEGPLCRDIPIRRTPGELDPLKPVHDQGEHRARLSAAELAALSRAAQREGITLGTLVLFAFGAVLSAYNGGADTLFGTVLSGRNHDVENAQELVGLTVNTLPLVFRPNRDAPVRAVWHELQWAIGQLNEHSAYPLRDIVDPVRGTRVGVNCLVAFENYPGQNRVDAAGLCAVLLRESEKTGYPLTVVCRPDSQGLALDFLYDRDVFTAGAMERMAGHVENVLAQSARDPGRRYAELDLLGLDERRALEAALTGPAPRLPARTIDEAFRARVARHPERLAVVCGETRLSYAELDLRSDQVRDRILATRPARESVVAIAADRSPELISALLGVLKAGSAYLPLDLESPPERIRGLLEAAGAGQLLVPRPEAARRLEACRGLPGLGWIEPSQALPPPNAAGAVAAGDDGDRSGSELAYVMFTSGSSGRPKAVMVEHHSVLRLVADPNYAELGGARVLQTGAPSFDASTFEIWGALLNGGTLYQIPARSLLDPEELALALRAHAIDTLWLTAPLFHRLAAEDASIFAPLKQLIVGGDVVQPAFARRVLDANPGLSLINGYGPTENTTFSTFYAVTAADGEAALPIGVPVSGTFCAVLDPRLEPVPIGVTGELFVGGEGLARGYLNDPEETAQRFVAIPSASGHARTGGGRWYRTGDLARVDERGRLGFLGRRDEQLKIRGHRVEPGEIEWQLARHSAIRESAVVRGTDTALQDLLVAYYVPSDAFAPPELTRELDQYLRGRLPPHMLPQRYVRLDELPLTPHGKLDRAELRGRARPATAEIEPEGEAARGEEAARSEEERVLRAVWQEVLGLGGLGPRPNFYALGGDSLSAIRVSAALKRRGYRLSAAQALEFPALDACSAKLQKIERDAQAPRALPPAELGAGAALGPAQRRFLGRGLANPHHFVIPLFVKLRRPLSAGALVQALSGALDEQDAHHVHFTRDERSGAIRQVYRRWEPADYFERVDLSNSAPSTHRERVTARAAAICRSFDIWKGPLFRVVSFERFEGEPAPLLLLVFHHLVSDGWSLNLLLDRVRDRCLCEGAGGGERGSYLAWAAELERYARSRDFRAERAYWQAVTEGCRPPRRGLGARPRHREMQALARHSLGSEAAVTALVRAASALGTTPFVVLLSAFFDALGAVSFEQRAIHLLTSQREHGPSAGAADLGSLMGYLSAAIPFRVPEPSESASRAGFSGFVRAVARQVRRIPNGGLDYLVLRYVLPAIAPDGAALEDAPDVLFHYLSGDPRQRDDDFYARVELPAGPSSDPENRSNYLVNFTVCLTKSGLSTRVYHSPEHVSELRAARLAGSFHDTLASFVADAARAEISANEPGASEHSGRDQRA